MLGKLLKYEFSATARQFLPLYAVLVVVSIVVRLFGGWDNGIFSGLSPSGSELPFFISSMVYFGLLVSIGVLTLIVMIQRFQTSLLGDEGYLMFTLPVRPWQLITSKLLSTFIWALASGLVTLLTLAILSSGSAFVGELSRLLSEIWDVFIMGLKIDKALLIVEIVLSSLISAVSGILMVYAAIALGHLFSHHRQLASFGSFMGLAVFTSILSSGFYRIVYHFVTPMETAFMSHTVSILELIFGLLFAAGYFILINYILSKRLNLE